MSRWIHVDAIAAGVVNYLHAEGDQTSISQSVGLDRAGDGHYRRHRPCVERRVSLRAADEQPMTELQIDRTACHMVRVFGLRAQGEAANLCRKIAARGDAEGLETWTEIRRKICALQLVHGDGPDTRPH